MKRLKTVIITITTILLVCMSIPFIAFIVLHYFILTPEKLTSLLMREVNERTHIQFECQKIELDYLDSWPSISLSIREGKVRIPVKTPTDSVTDVISVEFGKVFGNIQLLKLLKEQTLCIENIFIDEPDMIMELGQQLSPILKTTKKEKKEKQISFDIRQINISDAHLHLRHRKKGLETEADRLSAVIKGDLATAQPSFDIEATCASLCSRGKANFLEQEIAFSLQGHCDATEHFNDITLSDTRFFINHFPFEAEGSLHNLGKGENPFLDMRFSLLASSLQELLEFMPEKYLPEKKSYSVTGSTALKGEIKGNLKDALPDIKVEGFISQGSFRKNGIEQGIDTISLNLEMSYQETRPDSCFIVLHNVKVKGLGSSIQMENRITNLQSTPFITGDLKGHIDFDRIGREFISPRLAALRGQMTSDLSFAFNLKDLREGNLNRIWADGRLQAKHIEARSPEYHLDAFISGMSMDIGYKKNKSDFIAQSEVLSGTADIDSLKIAYAQSVYLNLSRLHLRSNTALSKDTSALVPVTAHLNCAVLQAKLDKDNWASAEGLELHAGTKPSPTGKKRYEGALMLKADKLKYLDSHRQNAIVLEGGEFITELRPKARTAGSASKWDLKGMLSFNGSQVYSAYFPLMVNLKQARLGFQNHQLVLNRLQMQAGKSDCIISGMLHTNPAPKGEEPKLEGTLQILSNTINYDELKQAFLYGEALAREPKTTTVSSLTLDNLEQKLTPKAHAKVPERLVYLPKDIQLDVQLDIENMNYHEIELQQVRGNMLIKDRQAYSQLSTRTNLGKADLSLLYDSRKREKVTASFDLDLKDVLVGQMHIVVPAVATLMPLTKDMDGLIDCRLTAEGTLDNQMMPILSTTKAACSLGGQKLVLIDNATFDEIARKFRFKNKNRNLIDNLSANLILQDGQIEVIPFLMQWDRYQAVIGGTHSTDFTYNYHLTMLKSPFPIDFGVNLSGKAGELKYKIGKCKYKELYKDGGTKHLQQTEKRMESIRQGIISHIKLQ